jgi:hypothetical protein
MRGLITLSCAAGLWLGLAIAAPAQDSPRDIINRAVKAHGGEERLVRLRAAESKSKGMLYQGGGVPFASESFVQMPHQLKNVLHLEVNGQNVTATQVLNGDRGWMRLDDRVRELEEDTLREMKEQMYADRVATLVVLKEPGFELDSAGADKVGDRPCLGVRVRSQGHRDVTLYFDRETGLLVKTATRVVDATSKQEVAQEKVLGSMQEQDGLRSPRRVLVLRDGKKYMDVEITETKLVGRLDESVFAKP